LACPLSNEWISIISYNDAAAPLDAAEAREFFLEMCSSSDIGVDDGDFDLLSLLFPPPPAAAARWINSSTSLDRLRPLLVARVVRGVVVLAAVDEDDGRMDVDRREYTDLLPPRSSII
jgi:hypothetical protein